MVLIWSIALLIINETGLFYSPDLVLLLIINLVSYLLLGFTYGIIWSQVIFISYLVIFWITDHQVDQTELIGSIVSERYRFLSTSFVLYFFCMTIVFIFKYQYNLLNKKLEQSRAKIDVMNQALIKESELIKLKGAELESLNKNLLLEKQNLAISEEKLKFSNEELKNYAHAASHDLKQPIRTIRSFADLLQRHLRKKGWEDKDSEEYLNFIKSGSTNMNRLVNDLLDYGRMASVDDLRFKLYDLNELFKYVEQGLKENINESQATIISDPLPEMNIIPVKISQLFINLINNAIKFRRKDQDLIIKLKVIEQESHWMFSLSDNGIGIETEFYEKIFSPFRKLHLNKEYDGSGLGLSTCKRIIDIHKGEIWVESKVGEGTTFFFTIQKGLQDEDSLKGMEEQIQETHSCN